LFQIIIEISSYWFILIVLKVMRYYSFMSLTTDEAIFDSRPKQKTYYQKKVDSSIWFLTVDMYLNLRTVMSILQQHPIDNF
jgi:hypothetical protein